MRVNELIPYNKKYQENKEKQLTALIEHIPDYDYRNLSFDFGALFVTIDHSHLYEVIGAFTFMGWTGTATNNAGQASFSLNKKVSDHEYLVAYIHANTFDDDKELLKDFHDRIKFG